MNVGIVGCGLNSDYHINFAKAYPGAQIVGIVDKDGRKANACAEKYRIKGIFSSVSALVQQAVPEVVHIVTPPETHFSIAKKAIESGCNVLVEKPLALNLQEAEELYDLAERYNVKLCTMHNHFFDPCMAGVHERVKSGDFGRIINVESYYGLNTQIPAFRDYPAPNVLPWLYTMPGGVYHDFMAHPLYVMLEYTGKPADIKVMQKTFGTLSHDIPDELRILINGEKAFGTLTFSFATKPHLHFARIYGTEMTAEVDFNTMTHVMHPVSSLPKAAQKATYNLSESAQLFTASVSNVANFIRGRLKPYQGLQKLIHQFYDSIQGKEEIPVTKQQALLVIETMDEIWKQLDPKPLDFAPITPQPSYPVRHQAKVLVTGGTGFLGKKLISGLVAEGYPVRVLARKLSNIEPFKSLGIEIFFGDVADRTSLSAAFEGIDLVVHAAAGTSGRKKDCNLGTMEGTRNVLDLCESNNVRKLVYISSCSVYGVAGYAKGDLVTEESGLEQSPHLRGEYSSSKQAAEELVRSDMTNGAVPIVILRPGTIYGPDGDLFTPMMGFSLMNKLFVVIGDGKFVLPYVYIDNLVDAIIRAIQREQANGQRFNVVDNHQVTKKEYMEQLVKKIYPSSRTAYFPLSVVIGITFIQEVLCKLLGRAPFLTRYRLLSSQKDIRYDSSKIAEYLEWSPLVSFEEAAETIVRSVRQNEENIMQRDKEAALSS